MNYASLYNMRSCFTVKRGGDPRDPWHRLRRCCCCGVVRGNYYRQRYSDAERKRESNTSRINFAIGEFYVRTGFIYYERAFAATSIHRSPRPTVWFFGLRLFFFLLFFSFWPSPNWGPTVLSLQLVCRIFETSENKYSVSVLRILRNKITFS